MNLLIVDDELHIREIIKKYAEAKGFGVIEAENGVDAIEKVKNNDVSLVIMDIMMPKLDGFSSVKEIRKFSSVPIIMLSARSEEYDKIYGFDLGIDDYVTKPFSPKELLMRVSAILNRVVKPKEKNEDILEYETLKIDLNARIVYVDDEKIDLTPKEYAILLYLMTNQNVALTREQLVSKIWNFTISIDDRTLDTHMKSLRKKIAKYANNIVTIRRVGYRFETK